MPLKTHLFIPVVAIQLCSYLCASQEAPAPSSEVSSIINPGGKFTPACLATSTLGGDTYGIYHVDAGEAAWISITVTKEGATKMIYSDQVPFLFPNAAIDSIPPSALKALALGYFRASIARAGGYQNYIRQNFASPSNSKGLPFPKGVPGEALKELSME